MGVPLRDFGRTGVKVSTLACGGHHLGDPDEESVARQIVNQAIDGGTRESAKSGSAALLKASATKFSL